MRRFNRYDIVVFPLIHINKIYDFLNLNETITINKNDTNSLFMKVRSGVILKGFNSLNKTHYIIVPITSKKIADDNVQNSIRSKITLSNMEESYLMWDSILNLADENIINLHFKNNVSIKLSNAGKKYIKKSFEKYTQNLFI